MDTKEVKEGEETGGAKRLSAEQPIVPDAEDEQPKGVKFAGVGDSSIEYASDVSESSDVIKNEFKDMYGESEEEEEELEEAEEEGDEEEEEEEETSEEEDLTEFKLQLEEKYMKGIQFSEEYLIKANQKIEDVPLQIYAIEIYINSIRTFFGYDNHWVRLKVFDSPCFDIRPCTKNNALASMYANMSMNQSKGSVYQNENEENPKIDLVETEIMTQKKRNKKMANKRLDFDLSNLSHRERRKTIEHMMRDEVTRGGTDFFTESKLKVQSKEKEVGLDIPIIELMDDEEKEGMPEDDTRGSKSWILREPLENGKTIMFPMRPVQFIHKLQRQPLRLFVLSTSGKMSSGQVDLSGLTEAVIRACKGPPYPISSVQRFKNITTGDFNSKIVGTVRVIAIGPQNISTIKCEDNINEQAERAPPRKHKPPEQVYNMDSQEDKPSILTGPQTFTLYDVVKNIRKRRQREKYQPPPKPAPKRYYVEDLVFNRAKNTVTRAPKKTYESLRAEIDRYLVLNKSRKPWSLGMMGEEQFESAEEFEDERSTVDEEVVEDEEIEEEHDERLEGEETAKRVEAVFHSLIQVYRQNWANYKPKASPSSSTSMVHERMPMKQDDSKISFSSSPIWRKFEGTNPERRKH